MSRLTGGIFSKPSGKTGGIVFSSARTRQGKLTTTRELVSPSNPNSPGQQNQRGKFKECLDIVKRYGSDIYRTAWNRSVGQLPGFQSLMSISLGQMDTAKNLVYNHDVNLGTLPLPQTLTAASTTEDGFTVSWSTELVGDAQDTDKVYVLAAAKTSADRTVLDGVRVDDSAVRSAGSVHLPAAAYSGMTAVYVYFEGGGDNAGIFSNAKFFNVVSE